MVRLRISINDDIQWDPGPDSTVYILCVRFISIAVEPARACTRRSTDRIFFFLRISSLKNIQLSSFSERGSTLSGARALGNGADKHQLQLKTNQKSITRSWVLGAHYCGPIHWVRVDIHSVPVNIIYLFLFFLFVLLFDWFTFDFKSFCCLCLISSSDFFLFIHVLNETSVTVLVIQRYCHNNV